MTDSFCIVKGRVRRAPGGTPRLKNRQAADEPSTDCGHRVRQALTRNVVREGIEQLQKELDECSPVEAAPPVVAAPRLKGAQRTDTRRHIRLASTVCKPKKKMRPRKLDLDLEVDNGYVCVDDLIAFLAPVGSFTITTVEKVSYKPPEKVFRVRLGSLQPSDIAVVNWCPRRHWHL